MKSDENRWNSEKLAEIECDGLTSNRIEFRLSVASVDELQPITLKLSESQGIARNVRKGTQLGCGKA